jgi:uncharacterized lipoprotein YmbA
MNAHLIRWTVVGVIVGWLPLAGCSFLAPRPDASRFFTLAALSEAGGSPGHAPAAGSTGAQGVMYGLGPIKVPAYLDRNEIATRVSPSEIKYSVTDYWAEPLQANVSRVLLQNLSALLDTDRIATYPWGTNAKVDYQMQVELLRFERDASGQASLSARWGIRAGTGGKFLIIKDANVMRAAMGRSTGDAVAALSGALGELSQQIADAVRRLPRPAPEETKPAKKRT